ncbi:MAG TPA: LysR family transcriptional regulator [Microbacterium sp.]|nr:LysR family transcriptional regulator [Microbacterium sp.]
MATIRALECLVAVADTGSITQAARLLHASQPAVSHQLASLERETRTALIRREARGVTLTPAGRAAVVEARRAIEAAAASVRSARAVGDATGGVLRLACVQSLSVAMLAPVIRVWRREHPEVTVRLRESTSMSELLEVIDTDEADLSLIPGPPPERFTGTVVAVEEIVLSAPTDHPLAQSPAVRIDQLDGVPLVHYAPENGLSVWLDQALADAGVRPEVSMRTAVTSAAPQLAAAGLGLAVSPVSAVSAGFPGAVRPFAPPWRRQLFAVTSAEPDPLAARFIASLRARGLRVPQDVRAQLEAGEQPAVD